MAAVASINWAGHWWGRLFVLFLLAVGAAIFFPINREAMQAGIPLLAFVFWQCAIGAALLSIVLLLRGERPPLSRADIRYYFVSGLLGITAPYIALLYAAGHTPVGVLSLSLTLEPAFTYAVALPLMLERFRPIRFTGLVLGIAGLMLIVLPRASLPSSEMVPWVLLSLVAPFGWACWSNWAGKMSPPAASSLVLTWGFLVAASLLTLPAMLATESWWWFGSDFAGQGWMALALGLCNPFFWVIGLECVRLAGPVFYSTWTFIGTPLTVGVAMVLYGERPSPWIWGALVLLLLSLHLVNRTPRALKPAR